MRSDDRIETITQGWSCGVCGHRLWIPRHGRYHSVPWSCAGFGLAVAAYVGDAFERDVARLLAEVEDAWVFDQVETRRLRKFVQAALSDQSELVDPRPNPAWFCERCGRCVPVVRVTGNRGAWTYLVPATAERWYALSHRERQEQFDAVYALAIAQASPWEPVVSSTFLAGDEQFQRDVVRRIGRRGVVGLGAVSLGPYGDDDEGRATRAADYVALVQAHLAQWWAQLQEAFPGLEGFDPSSIPPAGGGS